MAGRCRGAGARRSPRRGGGRGRHAAPGELREPAAAGSVVVEDRDGRTCREVRAGDGTRARWVPLATPAPVTAHALLAAEDRALLRPPGRRLRALVRAAAIGSVAPPHRLRGLDADDAARAHRPRRTRARSAASSPRWRSPCASSGRSTKDRILEQYVNRASFGPNLRGIGAASDAYFDKSVRAASRSPRRRSSPGCRAGPSLYQVDAAPRRARPPPRPRARAHERRGWLDAARRRARRRRSPSSPQRARPAFGAPHFVAGAGRGRARRGAGPRDALSARDRSPRRTIDAELQRDAEAHGRRALTTRSRGKHVTRGERRRARQRDGRRPRLRRLARLLRRRARRPERRRARAAAARARRSSRSSTSSRWRGSASTRRRSCPTSSCTCRRTAAATYAPHDYDGRFHGPVRLREALGNSLNVPAVWTADAARRRARCSRACASSGSARSTQDAGLLRRRHRARRRRGHASSSSPAPTRRSRAAASTGRVRAVRVAVGGAGGVTPISRDGRERRVMPAPLARDSSPTSSRTATRARRVVRRGSACSSFPFEVAAKTGTSKGYRDNWTVGFTREVTVGGLGRQLRRLADGRT